MTDVTNSATQVSLVLIALTLPTFLLGAPAGALVDRMDRRSVLWISNALRALATALFVLALLAAPQLYFSIYLLALLFSLVGLFFTPAEGALIPTLVDKDELLPALSLYNLTLNVTQVIGLLIIGPLALNLISTITLPLGYYHLTLIPVETLFVGVTVLYLIAAGLVHSLPKKRQPISHPSEPLPDIGAEFDRLYDNPLSGQALASNVEPSIMNWRQLRADLGEGWRLVRGDGVLLDSVLVACFGSLLMISFAGLATIFVQRLLNLPTSDTALVFTPAGLGIVAGSLLMPLIVARLSQTRTIIVGMVGMTVGIGMLPIVQRLARLADPTGWWLNPLFLLLVAMLTIAVGFSLDFIIVPAQAEMQERSPDMMRGRVLALYQALFNGGSIPVLLFAGVLTDLVGIITVLYVMAGISLCAAVLTILRTLARQHDDTGRGSPRGPGRQKWQQHQTPGDKTARANELPERAPL